MDFNELLKKRRSIRNYLTNLEVSIEKIIKIIEAGMLAPSIGDLQPWQFIVIKDREKIEKLAEYSFQEWVLSANTIVAIIGDKNIVKLTYEDRACENLNQTIGACIENMLLKATELGLGSCWVTIFDVEKVNELLKIPKNKECLAFITLGYPNEKPLKKKIKSLKLNTFFDEYGEKYKGNAQ
jgi:nitroreductase